MYFFVFIVFILIIILIGIIKRYNRIKRLKNKVLQSKSGVDVALKKRFDLIPNLAEVVKGYCSYEYQTIMNITTLRAQYYQSMNLRLGAELYKQTNFFLIVQERYPSLKANQNFLQLQQALSSTENEIAAARCLYNSDVTMFNNEIQIFPNNIVASIIGENTFEPFSFDERDNQVNINFTR